jgi:hypothetical protein
MVYISKSARQKVENIIEKNVIPKLKETEIDYNGLISGISQATGVSGLIVEELINEYISIKKIKLIKALTIPEEQIGDVLDFLRLKEEKEKETLKDIEYLDKILKGGEV